MTVTFKNEGRILQLAIIDEVLSFKAIRGASPSFHEFLVCLRESNFLKSLLISDYERKNNHYEIDLHIGRSGCRDWTIRWQDKDGFIYKKKLLHISMNGLLNEGVRIWLGDLQALIMQTTLSDYLKGVADAISEWKVTKERSVRVHTGIYDPIPKHWFLMDKDKINETEVCNAALRLVGNVEGLKALFDEEEEV